MFGKNLKVFLAPGATDLRKAINGLSILVENQTELNPFFGDIFGFCNRRKTIVKPLYWDTELRVLAARMDSASG